MTPNVEERGFRWSDAWLLLAADLAVTGSGPAALARVIGAADAIQHAILTKEELDGGLGRLGRAGYLRFDSAGVRLTGAGRALVRRAERAGRTYAAQQEALERLIGAPPWTAHYDARDARGSEPEVLTQAEYDAAVRDYYSVVGYRP